ncbi:hypothetical protein BH11BAC6_BH11BAC6_15720 [soil metagenome]
MNTYNYKKAISIFANGFFATRQLFGENTAKVRTKAIVHPGWHGAQ